ncbi:cytochrome P450 2U1-like [Crassostrea virginica]
MLGQILIAGLFLLIAYYAYQRTCLFHGRAPPGPKGWPLIGILFEFDLPTLHLKLFDWTRKYGEIFQFELLGKKFVSLNSSAVIREAFIEEPNATATAARPPTFYGEYQLDNYADIAFASPNPLWTRRRKLAHQLIRSYGKGLSCIEFQIKRNLVVVKEQIRSHENKTIDPSDIVEEFILNTVEVLTIGRSSGKNGKLQKILHKLDNLINITANPGYDALYGFLPFLRHLPLPMSRNIKELHETKRQMMEHLATLSEEDNVEKGIYQSLQETLKERDENGKPWFTKENVADLLMNLVAAGHLTTRGTIMAMIVLLAKRPELQKSLQKEVDRAIGSDREPSLSDRENCHLTEAFVLETLRYISHVPLSIFHAASEQVTIKGYTIQKNTVIVPNFWTVHHDEKEFEDPFAFKPERFLDKNGHLLPSNDPIRKRVFAFGIGKRFCLGEVFARSRIFLFISTLMQIATVVDPEGTSLSDLMPRDMVPGIVLQPQPFEVRFISRTK